MSAFDANTALYLNQFKLLITNDAGVTREDRTLPETILVPNDVIALSLRSAEEGYLFDASGNLYQTEDGAKSWSLLTTLDLSQFGELKMMPQRGLPVAAVRFFDADNGLLVLSLAGGGANKVVALRTSDGGQTWSEEAVPGQFGIPFISRDGQFITVTSIIRSGEVQVFQYTGD
ncbi:MAG: hypothetical protein EHM70_21300 [Chloroflexota bacterium]|nr:MAG: hypothetical protein EHM70_21300 [Chloroflexota bacterium]